MRLRFFLPLLYLGLAVALLVAVFSAYTQEIEDRTIEEMEQRLLETPIFNNVDTDQVRAIFEMGQQLGNRSDVFTTVGDSNTTNGDFLRPIGLDGDYCELGDYDELQATIDYYSTTPPTENDANSFTRESIAADRGFSTYSALDPFWADTSLCEPNESPLTCEYRVTHPIISLIMLGQIDINYAGTDLPAYRENMEQIVTTTVGQGVIPVLSTIVFLQDRDVYPLSLQFNMVILDLADEYQVPLINLWRAVQPLPDTGIGPDRSHLRAVVGRFCSFDGAETELGGTLRNLLNLQMLDLLRRELLVSGADE